MREQCCLLYILQREERLGPRTYRSRPGSMSSVQLHKVPFVEPQEDDRYRRIDVGRIYDSQIMKDFTASEQMEIELA